MWEIGFESKSILKVHDVYPYLSLIKYIYVYIFNFLQFYHHPNYISFSYLLVQFSSVMSNYFVTLWTATLQASLSITNSWNLLKLMSIELVMPSNHLILCSPLLLLPSIFSSIRVFSNESILHIRWPKLQLQVAASASVLPMNIKDWFPLGLTDLISLQSKGLSRVPFIFIWLTFILTTSHSFMCCAWKLFFHPHNNPVRWV